MLTPLAPASANSRASSPGWSGSETKTEAVGRGRAAVLAGDRAGAGDAALEDLAERPPVAGADRVDQDVELVADLGEQAGDGRRRSR